MKLATRLAAAYSALFLVIINIFGFYMIFTAFKEERGNAVYEANEQTANLMNVLSESSEKDGTTDADTILSKRLAMYYGGMRASSRGAAVFRAGEKTPVASSLTRGVTLTDDIQPNPGMLEHVFRTYGEREHELLVVGDFSFGGEDYYLLYSTNVTYIYKDRLAYIRALLLFDIIGGMATVFIILLISKNITRPLSRLTAQADRIAAGDYSTEIAGQSSITEIRDLSRSVGTMQSQIEERIASLEEKNAEQERFISSLTHEIRTPLTSVIGYSSLLLPKAGDGPMKEGLTRIHEGGLRIQSLTESLIRLLTVEKTQLVPEEIDMQSFLEKTLSPFFLRLQESGIISEITGDCTVCTDEALLTILVSNVIDNAIKAMADSPEKKLTLAVSPGRLTIRDTGKGIPKENLEKIFEPFYMVDKSRKHSYGGFGLGLAISAKIRDALGLTLSIASEPGKGTAVTIRFPG